MKLEVENMVSSNGNNVPNQFIITTADGRMFQSYNSNIAFIPNDGRQIILGKDWDYSTTTSKYRNQFLGESKKETLAKLKSGEYILDNDL